MSRSASDPSNDQIQGYWWIARVIFRRYENDFYQYNGGVLDESSWEGYRRSLASDVLSQPSMRAMWAIQRQNFGEQFRTFMDAEVDAVRGREPTVWADEWRRALQEEAAAQG